MPDHKSDLATRAGDVVPSDPEMGPFSVQLGGVRIYAADEATLRDTLLELSRLIIANANIQSCIDPNYLHVLCRQHVPVSRSIFRACLNAEARLGNIDFVRCLSEKGSTFKVALGITRRDEFRSQLSKVIASIDRTRSIRVRTVQDMFFPEREKGTWFIALNILQRLSYLGFLSQVDKWQFDAPRSLLDANAKINGHIVTPNAKWLA